MFEITSDDIALLNDQDLRSLVGLLCESEMRSRGLSTAFVTWGGHQDAADGGLDVCIVLPASTRIEGFVPRPSTGFQVKKEDMPRSKILAEMRPSGVIRPAIQELADQSGAYVIVSSNGSTSGPALRNRREAMVEAVGSLANASALTLDFYDRTRLATWVRDHASLILWVKEKIGKTMQGWRSYGSWAYKPEGDRGEYLLDNTLRIHTEGEETVGRLSAFEGIKFLRERLREPGKVVRLIGLSGVGKTRLVQALFDGRMGEHHLDPSLAIYTDIADGPDPEPANLVSDLVATRTRAIIVTDNCQPELHRRLSELCRSPGSKLSVITVEYDIREDEPEGTEVVRLEPSSAELIEKLVKHRFPEISVIDAQSIAKFSDGNARIAISLAGTVRKKETIAGLSDDELFRRLFHQRHEPDGSVMRAAKACSLVYSFQGEDVSDGDHAELTRLGSLVGQSAEEVYRSVAELRRRDLVQRRSVWRAVLPHAIANRLAATALQEIPFSVIEAQLVNRGSERLLKSFSRRLGYLHDSQEAKTIVQRWLTPGGLLANVAVLNDLGRAIFSNIAPVDPETTLSALQRAWSEAKRDNSLQGCRDYVPILRLLAYDAALFNRCIGLILEVAETGDVTNRRNAALDVFVSLFYVRFSGTHATIEQRLRAIEPLLFSDDSWRNRAGVMALKATLKTTHFDIYNFEFGARSRDYGFRPCTRNEVTHWFASVLNFSESAVCSDCPSAPEVRATLASEFRGLWTRVALYEEIEHLCHTVSAKQFWPEGWIAIRGVLQRDSESATPESSARLASLEKLLRPADLLQKVRSIVLSAQVRDFDVDYSEGDSTNDLMEKIARTEATARSLGKAVAVDEEIFVELLPELVSREGRLWSFGRGLVEGADDLNAVWNRLVVQFASTAGNQRRFQILCGFLSELHARDPELASAVLDGVLQNEAIAPFYPSLQASVRIDRQGLDRLMRSLMLGKTPIKSYRSLAWGPAASISSQDLRRLVLEIAAKQDGLDVAMDIIFMRINSSGDQEQTFEADIVDAGCELLRQFTFTKYDDHEGYRLGGLCKVCLVGDRGAMIAREICCKFKDAVSKYETHASNHFDLLEGLFTAQPEATLDGILGGEASDRELGIRIIDEVREFKNPLDVVPDDELLAWCDQGPKTRYPAVAGLITIANAIGNAGSQKWTNIALRILENAPDRIEVIMQFVGQFTPMSGWIGSLAGTIESNAKLLDELAGFPDSSVVDFVAKEKVRIRKVIESERLAETLSDQSSERFE